MLLKMTKVELVGPKHDLDAALAFIHEMGLLHIEDLTNKLNTDIHIRRMQLDDRAKALKENIEADLMKINSFLTALRSENQPIVASPSRVRELWGLDEESLQGAVSNLIDSIEADTRQLSNQKRDLQLELANLGKYQAMFNKMAPLAKELVALAGFDTIMLLVDKKDADVLGIIRDELSTMTKDQFQMIAAEIDGDTTGVILVYNRNYAKAVQGFIWNQHVNEVRLPEDLAKLPYGQAVSEMEKRRSMIPAELQGVQIKLDDLATKYGLELAALSEILTDRLSELQILHNFGATDYTFVIHGWLPKKQLSQVENELKNRFGPRILLEELTVSPEELSEAPIKYSNLIGIRSFEPLMELFGTPKYGSIDPTPFVAFFFPLFFGIILGDMGYALVILALTFWLKFRYKELPLVQNVAMIFTLAGLSSFIFGFIYGEFFGDLPERLEIVRHVELLNVNFPVDRQKEALVATLVIAVALGAAHIFLGLILGIVNASRGGSRKHLVEKIGLLFTLLGVVVLVLSASVTLPVSLKTPGTALIILSLPLLFYGGGFLGVLEILGIIGNVLSYARIMALGLVSVVLASLANKAGSSFGDNILLGIMVAALIHAVNIAIHLFTPSIHALRLNFVEFFSKFYEAGGKNYKPFKRGGYS